MFRSGRYCVLIICHDIIIIIITNNLILLLFQVQVYNPITKTVWKNLSRFREAAYGGSFRSDGRLICAGGEESIVRMFDVSTKTPLRIFKGHSA